MGRSSLAPLFAAFFRDLSIAWRALAAYPPGHPSTVAGLAKASDSLAGLLAEAGSIELAAARDALLFEDERFEAPTATRISELLRRRGAAAVAFDPGVEGREIERFLRALAMDARRARAAGSLAEELIAAGLVHIRARDLDFSDVALVDGEATPAGPEAGGQWDRLVRRILLAGGLSGEALARWLAEGRSAFDLLRMLIEGGGPADLAPWKAESVAAALRAAALHYAEEPGALSAKAIASLYRGLGAEGRARLVAELAATLGPRPDAARLLAPLLAALPEEGATALRRALAGADGAPPTTGLDRDRLARLRRAFAAADVDAFLDERPPARALEVLLDLPAEAVRPPLSPAALEIAQELAPATMDRAATLALLELAERDEVGADRLPAVLHRLESGFRTLLAGGRFRQALELVERVQRRGQSDAALADGFRRCAERLAGRDSMEALCAGLPDFSEEGAGIARGLVERLGPIATRHLVGLLAEAEDRQLRHRLLDLLAALGPLVVRDATHLLSDARWYVVRNMLLLLRRVGDAGSVAAVRRCGEHPDLRVRLEAIRNLFAFDQELPRELLRKALQHPDARLAEAAVELAGERGILEAAEPLADLLVPWDPFGARRAVRLKAIRALGALGDPRTLERLRRFSIRFALPPAAREERIAFYRSLGGYPEEARRPWIQRGLRSNVAEIRSLSASLAPKPGEDA